jgi:hypothetical protein
MAASPLVEPVKGHYDTKNPGTTLENMGPYVGIKVTYMEASPNQDIDITVLNVSPHSAVGFAHSDICGLLIKRLEDVSFLLSCHFIFGLWRCEYLLLTCRSPLFVKDG